MKEGLTGTPIEAVVVGDLVTIKMVIRVRCVALSVPHHLAGTPM
jgi:hypothetical protein